MECKVNMILLHHELFECNIHVLIIPHSRSLPLLRFFSSPLRPTVRPGRVSLVAAAVASLHIHAKFPQLFLLDIRIDGSVRYEHKSKFIQHFKRTFDATSLMQFVKDFCECSRVMEVDIDDLLPLLLRSVDALTRAELQRHEFPSCVEALHWLIERHTNDELTRSLLRKQLTSLVQGTQTAQQFFDAVLQFQLQHECDITDSEIIDHIINYSNAELQRELRQYCLYRPKQQAVTLLELLQHAQRWELSQSNNKPPSSQAFATATSAPSSSTFKRGPPSRYPPSKPRSDYHPQLKCWNCGAPDHKVYACPKVCPQCGKTGHFFKNCGPQKPPLSQSGQASVQVSDWSPTGVSIPITCSTIPELARNLAVKTVLCHNQNCVLGFDSLSCCNLVSQQFLKDNNLSLVLGPAQHESVVGFAGSGKPVGSVTLPVQYRPGLVDNVTFDVVDALPGPIQALLSYVYMKDHDIAVRPAKDEVRFFQPLTPSRPLSARKPQQH